MGTLKNITDEDKDVPLLRRTVKAGESVEVDDALLTNSDLCWPAEVWSVNGGTHEFDENSPENLAKAAAAQEEADAAEAKAAEEAATAAAADVPPAEPVTANPAADPLGATPAPDPTTIDPAAAGTTEKTE